MKMSMSRIPIFLLLLTLSVCLLACGGKKKDVAYYEMQIDSIRKAEQLKTMKQQAGVYDDPVEQFFDTLSLCPLPVRSAGGNLSRLSHFSKVPPQVTSLLGYPVDTPLRMTALPRTHGYGVFMLAEGTDSIPPIISLVTLDKQYQPVDELCIYEYRLAERGDDLGVSYNEYYIDSHYAVTIQSCFVKNGTTLPLLGDTRRYVIGKDGTFQEEIVELE